MKEGGLRAALFSYFFIGQVLNPKILYSGQVLIRPVASGTIPIK